MAGSVDLIQRCFTGLTMSSDVLRFAPRWPAGLARLHMTLRYRDHRLTIQVSADGLQISADPGKSAPIRIRCHGTTKLLEPGGSLEWRIR
jgi:alpha,alpha-trehalase